MKFGKQPAPVADINEDKLEVHKPKTEAAGVKAVMVALERAVAQAGVTRTAQSLLRINQRGGFDCPSCAWPESDKKRKAAAEAKNNAESLIHSTERQLGEHGDKVTPEVKAEIEAALAEAKTAVEGGDSDAMTEKTNALAQASMKLGQAIYDQQQAQGSDAGAGGGETAGASADEAPAEEEVVDAEFSEVDDETKQ